MSQLVSAKAGAFRLQYSIVRELGFTPHGTAGRYFPRGMDVPPFQEAHLLVPVNAYLKRTGVLDSWKAARP